MTFGVAFAVEAMLSAVLSCAGIPLLYLRYLKYLCSWPCEVPTSRLQKLQSNRVLRCIVVEPLQWLHMGDLKCGDSGVKLCCSACQKSQWRSRVFVTMLSVGGLGLKDAVYRYGIVDDGACGCLGKATAAR
jgi:hypothetical protein